MKHLYAGVGRADVTPAPGTPQGGWGAQVHQHGLGADMPLLVTALVLSDGETSVAIADIDLIHLSPEVEARAIALASNLAPIAPDHIRLSHSHTHSGPNTFRLAMISEGMPIVLEYINGLPHRIAGAIWQAWRSLRPVRCMAGTGTCNINVNRRFRAPDGRVTLGQNLDGTVDHTVRVVRFDDLEKHPVATIVHYACHPTIMAWQNEYFTPDYPGMTRCVVEEQIGGMCLFLQGAAGNIGPREGFTGDLQVYRRLGKILGLNASAVALDLDRSPRKLRLKGFQESGARIALYADEEEDPMIPTLSVISRVIDLPVREMGDPTQMEMVAAKLRARLKQIRKAGSDKEIRDATAMATQAGMRADRAKVVFGKTHLERRLMGIRVGDTALISTQGEPFIEISQEVEKASPFPITLFSGYSHGGTGYIPTPAAYEEGGYEAETTLFSPDAPGILVWESKRMLHELNDS